MAVCVGGREINLARCGDIVVIAREVISYRFKDVGFTNALVY